MDLPGDATVAQKSYFGGFGKLTAGQFLYFYTYEC